MVTVDQYARIRRAHCDGLSIRTLARQFHHSRRKIREIVATPEPKLYVRLNLAPSILDSFKASVDAILAGDETTLGSRWGRVADGAPGHSGRE